MLADEPAGRGRRGWLVGALIALALVVAGVVAFALTRDDEDDEAADVSVPATDAAPATEAPEPTSAATEPPAATAAPTTEPPTPTTEPVATDAPTTTATTAPPAPTAPPTAPAAPGTGTPDDPFALGVEGPVGDEYVVAILDVEPDADAIVIAENEINSPPPQGEQYVMITVRATYVGADQGDAYDDLSIGVQGDDGEPHTDTGCFALLPNDMVEQPTLNPGDTAEGTFCVLAPEEAIPTIDAFVAPITSTDDASRRWWRTG